MCLPPTKPRSGACAFFTTVDEIAQWHTTTPPQRCFEAVSSAAVKVPGSRLVVLTTAGEPSHWSRGVLDHALADPLWRVNEVPGPSHWLDPARLEGERRRLPESSYRRLFLNEWAASEDRLANEDDLAACVDGEAAHETSAPGVRYIVCVDIGLKHDRTVAAVCHAEKLPGSDRPRVVLDRMGVWQGNRLRSVQLSTVEAWIEQASREYNRARIRFDPWQAAGMAQRLKARGLPVEEFTFTAATFVLWGRDFPRIRRASGCPGRNPQLINDRGRTHELRLWLERFGIARSGDAGFATPSHKSSR